MNEEHEKKYKIDYDTFIRILKPKIFGFNSLTNDKLVSHYHKINDEIKKANDASYKMFSEMLGEKEADRLENNIPLNATKAVLEKSAILFIDAVYGKKTYAVDGVCLRINLLNCAVCMKRNTEMLGYISSLIEDDSRFLFVDFGDASGEVKIDIDEITIVERV